MFQIFISGLTTGLAPLYNSEVAPVAVRGAIGVVNQLAVTIGISLSQILGLTQILGDNYYWPLLLGEFSYCLSTSSVHRMS